MMNQRRLAVAVTAVALSLSVAACGSSASKGGSTGGGSSPAAAKQNDGMTKAVNASGPTGGTLKLGSSGDFDSADGGNTYYAWTQPIMNYYTRPLVSFKHAPGTAGLQIGGDLAQDVGAVTDNGLTVTYKLRPGVKYEDGTAVTSKDVKYALERSNWGQDILKNGPNYLSSGLVEDTTKYQGPYKDTDPTHGVSGIQTPDDSTIVFKLTAPFSDLDYVLTFPGSSPVPRDKDKGADYQLHPLSVGPYAFDGDYQPKKSLKLKKNANWDKSTDPLNLHPQMVDAVDLQLGMDQDDLDKQLLAGTKDIDVQATGVNPDAQHTILSDPALKAKSDSALSGREWFIQLNTGVKPFDDIHCRKAVQYVVDKVELQKAWGGENAGDIATTALPPNMVGYQKFDLYPSAKGDFRGDLTKAKAEMAQCSQPSGFTTVITARTERDKEIAAATALQAQLKALNITTTIQKFPKAKYFSDFAGAPAYANANNLGIMFGGWQSDWPDGYGMLDATTGKDGIKAAGGGNNLSQFDDPKIDEMFATAGKEPDQAKRAALWGQIDKQVMEDATMIPYLYAKALMFRPSQVTNVYVWQAYGTYDYIAMGVKR